MKLILTIIAIGFAQKYLGWGEWLWWMLSAFIAISLLDELLKKYDLRKKSESLFPITDKL